MTKILKHAGVEYNAEQLIAIKGQGIIVKTDSEQCHSDSSTIISADIKNPLVVKRDNKFLILIDSSHPRSVRSFEVVLISKHILKKTKIEIKPAVSQIYTSPQNDFRRNTPWGSSYDSPRNNYQR